MCEIDRDSDTMKEVDEIAQKKVEEIARKFHKHGIGCGQEIARLARDMHSNAVAIVPLYRSCIVIEQNDEEMKKGITIMHAYGDPHWLGRDINIENLRSDDFHTMFCIQGLREGPQIISVNSEGLEEQAKMHNQIDRDNLKR